MSAHKRASERLRAPTGGVMPEVLDEVPAAATAYEAAIREEEVVRIPSVNNVSVSSDPQRSHTGLPMVILATGGSAAGAAFVGGVFAGPIGALGGTVIGILLGIFLRKKSK
jgi:hypothetical protein